jgi:hypothetical protein
MQGSDFQDEHQQVEGTSSPIRRSWVPGFRTGVKWKKNIAAIIYFFFFMILFAITFSTSLWQNKIASYTLFLSLTIPIFAFTTNLLGLKDYLCPPSKRTFIRIFCWYIVLITISGIGAGISSSYLASHPSYQNDQVVNNDAVNQQQGNEVKTLQQKEASVQVQPLVYKIHSTPLPRWSQPGKANNLLYSLNEYTFVGPVKKVTKVKINKGKREIQKVLTYRQDGKLLGIDKYYHEAITSHDSFTYDQHGNLAQYDHYLEPKHQLSEHIECKYNMSSDLYEITQVYYSTNEKSTLTYNCEYSPDGWLNKEQLQVTQGNNQGAMDGVSSYKNEFLWKKSGQTITCTPKKTNTELTDKSIIFHINKAGKVETIERNTKDGKTVWTLYPNGQQKSFISDSSEEHLEFNNDNNGVMINLQMKYKKQPQSNDEFLGWNKVWNITYDQFGNMIKSVEKSIFLLPDGQLTNSTEVNLQDIEYYENKVPKVMVKNPESIDNVSTKPLVTIGRRNESYESLLRRAYPNYRKADIDEDASSPSGHSIYMNVTLKNGKRVTIDMEFMVDPQDSDKPTSDQNGHYELLVE